MTTPQAPFDFLAQQTEVTPISAPAGTVISNTGSACLNLIILQKGNVRVYRPAEDGRTITLYHITPGEGCILTASCILNNQAFPAVAEIEQAVEGLVIPADKVLDWLQSEPLWQKYVFSLLTHRMSDLIRLVDNLAFCQLNVRLAQWLLVRSDKNHEIQTTHQIIADELASAREVISRLLKEFEKSGLIQLKRGVIKIINKDSINKIK
ncbi:MAG: Crp/Fnr family transcriptional regulator [Methylococcales bacterium]|nr:Crp/Fnr family transcriptional regulator [Methylococcales bacterium]